MKPAPFDYAAPESLAAIFDLLETYGDDAKLLAGGQSLIPAMNFRLLQPTILVDLNRVPELDGITQTAAGGLRLGAMTRHRHLEKSSLVAQLCPLLAETMPFIAHPQIRNRGTIGGSLVHADPAAELPVITTALDARILVQSSRGERWLAVKDFFNGLFSVAIEPDEMVMAVELPPWPAKTGWSFMEVARRSGDYALAGVAAVVGLDDAGICQHARLVYLNLSDTPVDASQAAGLLIGQPISPEAIEAAANSAADHEIDPTGDIHASIDYKRHLARVLTRRALAQAAERAQ